MRLVFHAEDRSDASILAELVQRILGTPIDVVPRTREVGGVDAVRINLDAVAWQAWYSGADGIVIVIDNDGQSPEHAVEHGTRTDDFARQGCRYCELSTLVPDLPERPPLPNLNFVLGVPVQAIEAWLLFGAEHAGKKHELHPETIDRVAAKFKLYGRLHVPRSERLEICKPILENIDLAQLRTACPSFAHFESSVQRLAS